MNVQPGNIFAANGDPLRLLDRAVVRLRPAWRDVILLRFYGGKSGRQLAGELGLPPDTVRKRESQAVAAICRYYRHRGVELSEDAANRLLAVAFAMPAPRGLVERIIAATAAHQMDRPRDGESGRQPP